MLNRRKFVKASAAAGLLLPAAARSQGVIGMLSGSRAESSQGGGGGGVDNSIVPELGRTVWNPGIYEGIPADDASGRADGCGGATQHGSTIAAGASLSTVQSALDAAGAAASLSSRRFVKLGAGTFTFGGDLTMPSYVVLRGTINADGFTRDTIIRTTDGNSGAIVFTYGSEFAGGEWGDILSVNDVAKDASTITVSDASGISVGDIIMIDTLADGTQYGSLPAVYDPPNDGEWCWRGDLNWAVRFPYSAGLGHESLFPDTTGARVVKETHEVLAKNGNVLTIYDPDAPVIKGSPIRSPMYRTPQVYLCKGERADVRRFSGVEDLKIEPAGSGGPTIIGMNQAAFCWLKNVEIDGDAGASGSNGRQVHIREQCYRCEITGCYIHDAGTYGSGGGYGVCIAGSEGHIHNNVIRQYTKPFIFEGSGGGNVVAYNYIDVARHGGASTWQEYALGSHAGCCHYELIEGNWTPNMGPDGTHGNDGWWTMFRNYARGRNSSGTATGPQRCVSVGGWQREHYSIGNVLGDPALTWDTDINDFQCQSCDGPDRAIYLFGWAARYIGEDDGYQIGDWDNGQSGSLFHRHLDFNVFDDAQYDNSGNPVKTLPDSLYLTEAPEYFDGETWPWVVPDGANHAARVLTLPAKARYDAGEA